MEETEALRMGPILSNVVLHDVTTGKVLLPNVQFVYQGEELAPQVLQRAWITVHLQQDGSVAQINSIQPDARVNGFHLSNDETTGETLHVEGFFPFEVPELSHLPKSSYELLQEFQQRSSFIRSLLVEAADEGLFKPVDHSFAEDGMSRQLQPRLSDDGLDAFLHIPAPQPAPPHPQHTGQRDNVAVSSSSILSPQPHIKKQLLDDHSQSPPAERSSAATNNVEHHRHSRVDMHPQLQHSPDFNTGRSGGDVNEGEGDGDDDDDLARSEAERGQLKDIVLKFHRNRHALLSPPQDDDDFTSLPPMGLSAATPNRNTAPSPYPYQRDELLGSGGGVGVGGLAGDITMSPTPREAPKVCLSPYKRATLVYSGQHIHSSVSTSSSSSSSSTPSGSSSAVPTRKSLFNSGDALGTLGVSSSGVPSRHGHGIELGLLPSSSSPPLPMQREIVDKVKVALDEAVQSVKSRIIEEQLFNWAQPPQPNTRRNHYPAMHNYQRPEITSSPTAMPQASYQRYEEPRGADQVLSGRQMLRTSSSGVAQYAHVPPSYSPPPAIASSPTSSPPFVPRDYH
ncbi:uncharacterized protein ACA1_366530 [Acanthamoeba castellanii str. Neff]|uniref:Uncharacterized protein n=1 Tax=Acanthamoeba castellanii (strain ATCC 30010 / Neff) TaxID=1257118 RepID=L8GPJ2_ACACF|nr:uncharacterized protein ACA1_366530 [Acanthamoeba castellanii str. Neff]ELR14041.1 hypothetical protein ACA1_366530 [Acanthamoeba castellanii str. Neff]